ncbi:MAG: hypothetical protein WBF14_13640 [Candidatus Acidiferrales bacterium]
MKSWALFAAITASFLAGGCAGGGAAPRKTVFERDLPLTWGGFLLNGDPRQRIECACAPDENTRSILKCEVHNGLHTWRVTELDFRVNWYPYGDGDVGTFRERVSIEPGADGAVSFGIGTRLVADTKTLSGNQKNWILLLVGAKAVRSWMLFGVPWWGWLAGGAIVVILFVIFFRRTRTP